MSSSEHLLFELGTEELPPKDLARLATSLCEQVESGIKTAELSYDSIKWFATPRRLAVKVENLQTEQASKQEQRRGPAVKAAYDSEGNPTKAAEGFAQSCKTTVDQLETLETDKGQWLAYTMNVEGQHAKDLLPNIIQTSLNKLPIAKRMRWGNNTVEFVRPVQWSMLLLGEDIIDAEILGTQTSNISYGHRFHAPNAMTISNINNYESLLKDSGHVIVDYKQRKQIILDQIKVSAESVNGEAIIDPGLLDEVTSINEWPVAVVGSFDEEFLALPKEALIYSMQDHQKYFPIVDSNGDLLAKFITFANIESKNIEIVRKGNERVLSPRLKDAQFFWQQDTKQSLADYQSGLENLLYQKQLGSMAEKSSRVSKLSRAIAASLKIDSQSIERAALLAKCDLLTDMVGEFPNLQGAIGYYYAKQSGEPDDVAKAIDEQYMPRFSGDDLPETKTGQILSLAEKIETIVGIFSIGQIPTGEKDPFALKRAALGAIRIIIECNLDIDLSKLISNACYLYEHDFDKTESHDQVFDFIIERLRNYYQDNNIDTLTFESVLATQPTKPLDFDSKIKAVMAFQELPEAEDLAAANKRISNILKKQKTTVSKDINSELLTEAAEQTLVSALNSIQSDLQPLLQNDDYQNALSKLATLRDPIDAFFDNVMVMAEDEALKNNRLSLLQSVQQLFIQIADISKLQQ